MPTNKPEVVLPELPVAVRRLIFSKDLYELLLNVQNGIDSPGNARMASSVVQLLDKARDAAMLSAAPQQHGQEVKGGFHECPHCKGWSLVEFRQDLGDAVRAITARYSTPAIDIGKLRELVVDLRAATNIGRVLTHEELDELAALIGDGGEAKS